MRDGAALQGPAHVLLNNRAATVLGSDGETQQQTLPHTMHKNQFQVNYAKSLQSCPTLCDPIDGIPPGSPVPGILQARTLEWVAIYFSNA